MRMGDRDRGVLVFLSGHFSRPGVDALTTADVAGRMGRDQDEVDGSLGRLRDEGFLVAAGTDEAPIMAVLGLSPKGQEATSGP